MKTSVKYIWSNKYGTNPTEGLHKHLQKVVIGYKRSQLQTLSTYISGGWEAYK